MKKLFILFCFIGFSFVSIKWQRKETIANTTPLVNLLELLGEYLPKHYRTNKDSLLIQQGRDLVFKGKTIHKGHFSKLISKSFKCISCHNVVREDSILNKPSPTDRLRYAKNHNLPFLQGTTFWGMVNRTSWFNGDYVKKYGDLVKPANTNLEAAIQLCSSECSQGRLLEKWEMEAMLTYLWSLELTVSDLDLTFEELDILNNTITDTSKIKNWLSSKYLLASLATFSEDGVEIITPNLIGDTINGKTIYQLSCKHCHKPPKAVSDLILNDNRTSFENLNAFIERKSGHTFNYILRKGTKPSEDAKIYMPLFPLERMSNQQIVDLKAFIKTQL